MYKKKFIDYKFLLELCICAYIGHYFIKFKACRELDIVPASHMPSNKQHTLKLSTVIMIMMELLK